MPRYWYLQVFHPVALRLVLKSLHHQLCPIPISQPILSYQGTVMLVSGAVHHEAPMDRCLSLCIPTLLCTLFFLVLKKTKPYPFKVPNFGWQPLCYATNRNQRKIVGFSTGSDGELPSLGNRLSSTQQLSDLNFVTVRTVAKQIETVTI